METQTETKKLDKRTKEYKESTDLAVWTALKESAIPVKEAVFHRNVKSWNGEPETAFYATGGKPSRTARMWYSTAGLLCEQEKNTKRIIPLANVVYAIPL